MPLTLPQIDDRTLLALVKSWCLLRHHSLCRLTSRHHGRPCEPATPAADSDKFLWRKIFDHNPLFAVACDKLAAKEHAVAACPGLKAAEVLWVGTDPDRIPAQTLSGDVMIKANSSSGANVMVRGGKVDRAVLREQARSWLDGPYGQEKGEWGYKDGRRCLFVERMLVEDGQPVRQEYKFHVVGGRTVYVFVTRRADDDRRLRCHFLRDGQLAPEQDIDASTDGEISLPAAFERMVTIAERLAAPFDYMRCDLYALDGEIYFSELTPYPQSGLGTGNPYFSELRNAQWDLRQSWFLTTPQPGWRGTYAAALCRWLDEQSTAQTAAPQA